jgi:hypothetical protein
MAPSVAQIPETTEGGVSIPVHVKAVPLSRTGETKAKVRRVTDEEGGKTDASVRLYMSQIFSFGNPTNRVLLV